MLTLVEINFNSMFLAALTSLEAVKLQSLLVQTNRFLALSFVRRTPQDEQVFEVKASSISNTCDP